jgi:hypothetical protein
MIQEQQAYMLGLTCREGASCIAVVICRVNGWIVIIEVIIRIHLFTLACDLQQRSWRGRVEGRLGGRVEEKEKGS